MPSITTPDVTGDLKISWDPDKPEDVKNAKAHFDDLKKKGHIFYTVSRFGKKKDKVDQFDPEAGKLVCEFDPKADVMSVPVLRGG